MTLGISTKFIIRNAIAGLAILLLWFGWLSKTESAEWIVGQMLPGNMEIIEQHPDLSLDQRWEFKLGAAFNYLQFIKQRTPENAVILYPDHGAFFPAGVESPFRGTEPYNKVWATRFLHPRRLVLRSESGTSPYTDNITHVAIVNGIGYDVFPAQQLPDSTDREAFTIIAVQ